MRERALKSTLQMEGEIVICNLTGDISYDTVIQLRNEFSEIRNAGKQHVILDLIHLQELGSAGLGEMARLILWCESNNSNVKMVCTASHICEILAISGLEKYSPLFATLSEAIAASN